MAQYNVTSISKLPKITDVRDIKNDDLYIISQNNGSNSYITRSVELSSISQKIANDVSAKIEETFELSGISGKQLSGWIVELSSGTSTFGGKKTFSETPSLSSTVVQNLDALLSNDFITRDGAEKLIASGVTMFGSTSNVRSFPDNDTPYTTQPDVGSSETGKADGLYQWVIENGSKESTASLECDRDGQLVVYGWLASDSDVLPQDAWVGIFGEIETTSGSQYTLLQLQPWIMGTHTGILQYIGFNIPVRQGLKLKIKTGFRTNMTATAFNSSNTLTYSNVTNNTFVGYIAGL